MLQVWDDAAADTGEAIIQAYDSFGDDAGHDQINSAVWDAVGNLPQRTINSIDIPWLDDEELHNYRRNSDEFYSMNDDLVSDTGYLHTGRPGECGPDCPALLPRTYPFGDVSDQEMRVLRAFQETGDPPEE